MLQVNQLVGFGGDSGRVVPVTKTFEAHTQQDGGTTYTFSSHDLGSSGTKKIVVAVTPQNGAKFTLSGVTVDGQTATQVIATTSTHSTWDYKSTLWQAHELTSSATGDIVVSCSGLCSDCDVAVWVLLGAASSAHDTSSDNTTTDGTLSTTLDIPAGGVGIAMSTHSAAHPGMYSTDTIWSGLTEDWDSVTNDVGGNYIRSSGSSKSFASAESGLTVSSANAHGNINDTYGVSMVCASWGPA